MLQYLGLILVVLSWISGYYLVSRWYDKALPTISKHAASNKEAARLFKGVLIGLGIGFFYWLIVWFVPHLQLGMGFQLLLAAAILCQIIAAMVPDTHGWRHDVHFWSAYTMAVLYLPLSVYIATSPQLTLLPRIICTGFILYMMAGFIVVAIMGKAKGRYLLFQASYIITFQMIILIAAYM